MKKSLVGMLVVACAVAFVGCAQTQKVVNKITGKDLKTVHFDLDKSNIRKDAEPAIKENAEWLKAHGDKSVSVEGHCDERGSTEYNVALGDRRANSAKKYMQNLGIAANKISTISYGEEKPVCKDHNEGCWSKNRRAEFIAH